MSPNPTPPVNGDVESSQTAETAQTHFDTNGNENGVSSSECAPVTADVQHAPDLKLNSTSSDGNGRDPSPSRVPTSAEIDAVIAAAMANAAPVPSPFDSHFDGMPRPLFTLRTSLISLGRSTPLMTNLLPAAVGADGRVNLFVGNVSYKLLGTESRRPS
jgi:hypothetical protein